MRQAQFGDHPPISSVEKDCSYILALAAPKRVQTNLYEHI
jgi:hypothetical protein